MRKYSNILMNKGSKDVKNSLLTCLPPLLRLVRVVVAVRSCDLIFLCQVFCCDAHRDLYVQVSQTCPQSVL